MPPTIAELLPSPSAIKRSVSWLHDTWLALAPHADRPRLYSRFLAYAIPYTGSVDATVQELRPGFARVTMEDRPALRNHLGSVHAIALSNLAELAGNAALAAAMPPNTRFIVTEMNMRYLKKAHGRIEARSKSPLPETCQRQSYEIEIGLFDSQEDEVAHAKLTTLVGPIKT